LLDFVLELILYRLEVLFIRSFSLVQLGLHVEFGEVNLLGKKGIFVGQFGFLLSELVVNFLGLDFVVVFHVVQSLVKVFFHLVHFLLQH
jgi:hypothetical protein